MAPAPQQARVSSSAGEHACLVCSKTFLSHRALNGHMRVHGGGSAAGHDSTTSNLQLSAGESLLRIGWRSEVPSLEEEMEVDDAPEEEADSEAEEEGGVEVEVKGFSDVLDVKKRKVISMFGELENISNLQSRVGEPLLRELRQNPKRSCFVMDKDFVHFQEHGHLTQKASVSAQPNPELFACNIAMCAKNFRSQKALFGHMRWHTDKGHIPPKAISKALTALDMPIEDMVKAGCRMPSIKIVGVMNTSELVQKEKLAVHKELDHMTLRASTSDAALTSKSFLATAEEQKQAYSTAETRFILGEVEAAIVLMMLSVGLTDLPFARTMAALVREDESRYLGSEHSAINMGKVQGSDLFECRICGKGFSSHQALGGHTAKHAKLNKLKTHDRSADENLNDIQGHECSRCHRIFSTGQALGGHMRRHWANDEVKVRTTV